LKYIEGLGFTDNINLYLSTIDEIKKQ